MNPHDLDEPDCLSFDPFSDDFGSPGDRVLSDKIVTARKSRECFMCAGTIEIGTRIRVRSEICDEDFHTSAFCMECCIAMAHDAARDGCREVERRYKLADDRWRDRDVPLSVSGGKFERPK